MKRLSVLLAGLVAISLISCGANRKFESEVYEESAVMNAKPMMMAKRAVADNAVNGFAAESIVAEDVAQTEGSFERKLIRNGSISLEVTDLLTAQEKVEAWCKSFGGYVSSSYTNQRNAGVTVRIPAEKFDQAMESVGEFGTVKNKDVSIQDVSEQFYDLQGRLETRKVLKQKLEGYLKQASNMQDLLKIERELNSVQSEIESMEGRLKRLSSQIDFSTINVNLELPYNSSQGHHFDLPDFGYGVRHFAETVVGFFGGFVAVVLYIFIFGIPMLAVLALLYWLLLGKVGLLKKIIRKLK